MKQYLSPSFLAEMERLEQRTQQILAQGTLFGSGVSLCACSNGTFECPEHGYYKNKMTPYLRARRQALAELEGRRNPRRRRVFKRDGGRQGSLF